MKQTRAIEYTVIIWLILIVLFAAVFHLLQTQTANLNNADSFLDALYFSVVATTSTGFGDITPTGYFKILTIIEILLGFTLFAYIISKFVSAKQEQVIEELHRISYSDRIHRIRTTMLLFRQNVFLLREEIKEKKLKKEHSLRFYSYLAQLNLVLEDILYLLTSGNIIDTREEQEEFKKILEALNKTLLQINNFEQEHADELYTKTSPILYEVLEKISQINKETKETAIKKTKEFREFKAQIAQLKKQTKEE